MWRDGNELPMMHINVSAVGAVSTADKNVINAEKFTEFIKNQTGLPSERYLRNNNYTPVI